MKRVLAALVLTVSLLAALPASAGAVNFDLCDNWSGWRYGGDGFDYKGVTWTYDRGHIVHTYYKRSVLNGSISRWRIYCS